MRPYGFDCAQVLLKREMQAFQLDSILLSIDTIIISEYFNKKCFSYRKVKTRHVYLWRGLTRCFVFQRTFETLIIQLSVIFSRWYSRLTRVLFNCNARVRPSIIEYRIRCCGAQETSWMTICISVLVIYIFRCVE